MKVVCLTFLFLAIQYRLESAVSTVKLYQTNNKVMCDMDFTVLLNENHRKRLTSGLLSKIEVHYVLKSKSDERVKNGELLRLWQFDIFEDQFIVKTTIDSDVITNKYLAKSVQADKIFGTFTSIPVIEFNRLSKLNQYRLEVTLEINPLSEQQKDYITQVVSRKLVHSNREPIKMLSNNSTQTINKELSTLPFLGQWISQFLSIEEKSTQIYSDWKRYEDF